MIEEEDDLDMMRNPRRWPAHPFLPLKNRREEVEHDHAVLLHAPVSGRILISYTNMFALTGDTMFDQVDDLKSLVDSGWMVD